MHLVTDYHVHTEFSGDCNTPMEDIIHRAIDLGLKEVMFTDHIDFDYPSEKISFEIDFEEYMEKINCLRRKYSEIDILMGVEIGYQFHLHSRIDSILCTYPFDFVIGSIHVLNGLPIDNGNSFKGKSQQEGYEMYLESLKYAVENFDNCDVFGHLDFVIRYGDFHNKELKYMDFKHIIDEILLLIIRKGKGIELNTSGLRYDLATMHPNIDILKRYREIGGEIITLGSDAHRAEDLCADFPKAINLLKDVGFTKIAKFKNRIPTFISI